MLWNLLRKFPSIFHSYSILSVTYSLKPSQPSRTVSHQDDHRRMSAVVWRIFSHIFTGSLCFTSQLLHRSSLLVLYASRTDLNGSVWLCAVYSQEGKQPLLRQAEQRSSFFFPVDLVLRDYKNFFISLVALCSLGTCPPFLRSFASFKILHRFKFFRGFPILFSFCIFAFFASFHNVKALFHVISFMYYFSHLSFLNLSYKIFLQINMVYTFI